MMTVIEKRYSIPSRNTAMRNITAIFESISSDLKQEIRHQVVRTKGFCSITADLCTSTVTEPYMAVTLHYIKDDWTLNSKLLQCCYLPGSHTGEVNIADAIIAHVHTAIRTLKYNT